MRLTGGALKTAEALTPAGHEAQIDITITDEGPMAVAFVIISAVPASSNRRARCMRSSQRAAQARCR